MIDFAEMVLFHASISPDKPALIADGAMLTYAMLRRGILSAERRLRQHGLKAGDCVAVNIVGPIAHVTLLCALYRAGITSVSLYDPQLDAIDDLVIDAYLAQTPTIAAGRCITVDDSWFNDKTADLGHPPAAARSDDSSVCRFILSSGTTGRSKIIGLTFQAVRERLISYAVRVSTPSWDRMVCLPGLGTNFGFSFVMTALWLGRTVCISEDPDARQYILAHQAELLIASTHQIMSLVTAQEEKFVRLASLRSVHVGGSVAYPPLQSRVRMLLCPEVFWGYGSTEGGTVAYAPADTIARKDRSVGIVAPWIELRVDKDDDAPAAGDEAGRIRLRALGQGFRYTKTSASAYEVDRSEWFDPGDEGTITSSGLLTISGRTNEIINRGGVKAAPDQIEEEIKKHPHVTDAAAVGILDDLGIEQIWLAVILSDDSSVEIADLHEHCRVNIPMYAPDRIFPVYAIPRNALGKVSRVILGDELRALREGHVGKLG